MTRSHRRNTAGAIGAVMALSVMLAIYNLSGWFYFADMGAKHNVRFTNHELLCFMIISALGSLVLFFVCTLRGSLIGRSVFFIGLMTMFTFILWEAGNIQISNSNPKDHPELFSRIMMGFSVVYALTAACVAKTLFYEPASSSPPQQRYPATPKNVPANAADHPTLLGWALVCTAVVFAIRAKQRSRA